MNIKVGKFYLRATLSILLMGIGASIFFSSKDDTMRLVGSNMVTASWAGWMSTGSSKIKKYQDSPIEIDASQKYTFRRDEQLKEIVVHDSKNTSSKED